MIIIKSLEEIDKMRKPNRVAAEVLKIISNFVKAGIATYEIDNIAEQTILSRDCLPAFKGYRGFPNTLCVSINDEVVHGIPSKRKLKTGDVLSIDVGVLCEGYFGDSAVTLGVGGINNRSQQLIDCTKMALTKGIESAIVGNRVSDISHSIQTYAESKGFSVVRSFVGHGIGTSLHEDPQVPNYGDPDRGAYLREGMVLAIEPMINMRGSEVLVLNDNWTVVTKDGSLSAHFEHTVAITNKEAEILTVF